MPQIPTIQEPGSALLQQSNIDVSSLSNTGQATVQAASAVASSLMGDAKSAANRMQSDVLQQIATNEEIAKKSAIMSKLFDLRTAATAMSQEMEDTANSSGQELDVSSLKERFSRLVSESSQGLDKEQQLALQQSSFQLLSGLEDTANSLNKKTKINNISVTNDKADSAALGNIYRLDRMPTQEDLQSAIDQKAQFYQSVGFTGTALENLIGQTKKEYTDKYGQVFTNLVMQSGVSGEGDLMEIAGPDGSTGLVSAASVQALQALNSLDMSPDLRMELADKLSKDSEQKVGKFLQRQDAARQEEMQYSSWRSGRLLGTSEEAKKFSNLDWLQAQAMPTPDANPNDPASIFKEQLNNYYTINRNATRLPDTIITGLRAALDNVNDPAALRNAATMVDAINKLPNGYIHLSKDMSPKELAMLTKIGSYGTNIGADSIKSLQQSIARDIRNPDDAAEASKVFNDTFENPKDVVKSALGFIQGLKLIGDSVHSSIKDAYGDAWKEGYISMGKDPSLATEYANKIMSKNLVIAPNVDKDRWNMSSVVLYMPGGGTIGNDFKDTVSRNLDSYARAATEADPTFYARYGLDSTLPINDHISGKFTIIPIINPLEKTPGVAYYNLVSTDGLPVQDRFGVNIPFAYKSPSGSNSENDAKIAAARGAGKVPLPAEILAQVTRR